MGSSNQGSAVDLKNYRLGLQVHHRHSLERLLGQFGVASSESTHRGHRRAGAATWTALS